MNLDEKNINIQSLKEMLDGKHSSQNKIQVTVGDYAPTISRKVGDKWTDDDGNEWEQKEGYAVKLGKEWQQELHQYLNSFSNCPKESCTCTLPKRLDEKMKAIHGMCFDCVIEMEHKLKIQGKYKDYEQEKIKQNALAWLRQAERDKDLVIEELTRTLKFVNSNGMVESWASGTDPDEMRDKIEKEFERFKTDILKNLENLNAEAK